MDSSLEVKGFNEELLNDFVHELSDRYAENFMWQRKMQGCDFCGTSFNDLKEVIRSVVNGQGFERLSWLDKDDIFKIFFTKHEFGHDLLYQVVSSDDYKLMSEFIAEFKEELLKSESLGDQLASCLYVEESKTFDLIATFFSKTNPEFVKDLIEWNIKFLPFFSKKNLELADQFGFLDEFCSDFENLKKLKAPSTKKNLFISLFAHHLKDEFRQNIDLLLSSLDKDFIKTSEELHGFSFDYGEKQISLLSFTDFEFRVLKSKLTDDEIKQSFDGLCFYAIKLSEVYGQGKASVNVKFEPINHRTDLELLDMADSNSENIKKVLLTYNDYAIYELLKNIDKSKNPYSFVNLIKNDDVRILVGNELLAKHIGVEPKSDIGVKKKKI